MVFWLNGCVIPLLNTIDDVLRDAAETPVPPPVEGFPREDASLEQTGIIVFDMGPDLSFHFFPNPRDPE